MRQKKDTKGLAYIIGASSVGTLIEWYDFYIFGSLAFVISTKFFPSSNPSLALISTLATFAAGFVVRPFGALLFGRLGDIVGRKYTFMITLLLMGVATFLIGLIPSYETIGVVAPILVLLMRLLQGLALGGEYGGAATYVAEHSPAHQRGFWTSWIQTTATMGLLISLTVIYIARASLGEEKFNEWGWRLPFVFSLLVVIVSYYIRSGMHESPLFAKVKAEGKTSTNPLRESFGHKYNLKFVLVALLAVAAGQGMISYTGQFYSINFMKASMHVSASQAESILIWAVIFATPFFVIFGWLSDKIGRKWIIMLGFLLAIITYRSIFDSMYNRTNVDKKTEIASTTELVSKKAVMKDNASTGDSTYTTLTTKNYTDGTIYKETKTKTILADKTKVAPEDKIDKKEKIINTADYVYLVFAVFFLLFLFTLVYGPGAAFFVELFPVHIRYTSMSLPYHVGHGIFGGLVPAIAASLVINADNINKESIKAGLKAIYEKSYLEGLWYPLSILILSLIVGVLYLSNKKRHE